jgi:hypothetical protein
MNYKEYLETSLQAYTTDYVIKVFDEVNYNYNPKNNEIVFIIKKLSGSVIGNVEFKPIQLEIFGAYNETNLTMQLLEQFVKDYSNTNFNLGLDYYKQDYSTPINAGNFNAVGNGYRTRFIVTGSLMITNSISDVDKLYINNKEINFTNVIFSYSTNPVSARQSGDNLQKTLTENANLSITITGFKNADILNGDLALLKTNKKGTNDIYNLKMIYTDNAREETYKCIINSFNENHDRTNPATRNVVFTPTV